MSKGIFSGKRFLMLGSNAGSADLVCYAKSKGAYTIVADNLSQDKSEAKRYSDENALVSTADIEGLKLLVKEKRIDGVMAGISEFNLLQAMELSDYFGMRFYCNKEQWEMIERKDKFRELCERYDVPCPITYFIGSSLDECKMEELKYPLVIKPVDSSASIGVHICYNESELKMSYCDAYENSESGLIIIEEYVAGDEFTAHYTFCNGNISFSCIDNRYPIALNAGNVTTIPIARLYPSLCTDQYIKRVNPSMLELCKSLHISDGVMFVQGLYNKDTGLFKVFEAGLRSAAELPNRFIEKVNGINYMNNIVDYILLGKGSADLTKDDPHMKGKCCGIVSFVARHGTVGDIVGLEDSVKKAQSVIDYECRYPVGSITPNTDTLRQLMIRFVMICDSREIMSADIEYLNEHINVYDIHGNDMVLKFDPNRIIE